MAPPKAGVVRTRADVNCCGGIGGCATASTTKKATIPNNIVPKNGSTQGKKRYLFLA
jgi:hypothetical protein